MHWHHWPKIENPNENQKSQTNQYPEINQNKAQCNRIQKFYNVLEWKKHKNPIDATRIFNWQNWCMNNFVRAAFWAFCEWNPAQDGLTNLYFEFFLKEKNEKFLFCHENLKMLRNRVGILKALPKPSVKMEKKLTAIMVACVMWPVI